MLNEKIDLPSLPSFFRKGAPVYVIAEGEINHNGNLETALEMVEAAKEAGADAIKFQFIVADEIATPDSPYHAIFKSVELSKDDFAKIFERAQRNEIVCFLTVPSIKTLVPVLELKPRLIKIGSTNLTNLPLLEVIGGAEVPVLFSTGIGRLGEIEEALAALNSPPLPCGIMHCTVQYPAKTDQLNLRSIPLMAAAFTNHPIGYSDHTLGNVAAISAVTLGARIIEKHFTLDQKQKGPDHGFSTEPVEFKRFVEAIRETESALGDSAKRPAAAEAPMIKSARRYLVAARNIAAGKILDADDLALRRVPPDTEGIEPRFLKLLIGWKAPKTFKSGEPLSWLVFKHA
ncbi:MAG: N-acetylneuraminate synthase family protein [Verrucomicrobiota bacterium]